ncbi:MAG: hypothetical protein U0P81_10865 [Holophagaceae bacterium]
MGRRIAILLHERMPREDLGNYNISRLIPVWEADGHQVSLLFGTSERTPADLLFVHVDLSVVPDEYLAFAADYPAAVNGKVRDIRKSTYSPNRLRPGDPWTGPVIVKSERNHGGTPEARHGLLRLDGEEVAPLFQSQLDYRVFDSLEEVPREWFGYPDLLVQGFTPEWEDGLFHVRNYQFLGDWSAGVRMASSEPIVSVESKVSSAPCPVPAEIVAERYRLGFDYGKFDFVIHGGRPLLLDVNKTLGGRSLHRAPDAFLAARHAAKARALYAFFP